MQKHTLKLTATTSHIYLDDEPAKPTAPTPPTAPPADDGKITLTKAELEAKLAEAGKSFKQQAEDALNELNALKNKASLTIEEKKKLEARFEELQQQNMTKEELAQREIEKQKNETQAVLESLTAERDSWKDQYTKTTIVRSLSDAANKNEAFNSDQIVAILGNNTALKEKVDADGKPSGQFEVRVQFADIKDGQPITLDLTAAEAVKRMREIEGYQNLFKGEGVGGTGSHNRGAGGKLDPSKMTPEQYRTARKKGLISL